jgi:hypothetical protein
VFGAIFANINVISKLVGFPEKVLFMVAGRVEGWWGKVVVDLTGVWLGSAKLVPEIYLNVVILHL